MCTNCQALAVAGGFCHDRQPKGWSKLGKRDKMAVANFDGPILTVIMCSLHVCVCVFKCQPSSSSFDFEVVTKDRVVTAVVEIGRNLKQELQSWIKNRQNFYSVCNLQCLIYSAVHRMYDMYLSFTVHVAQAVRKGLNSFSPDAPQQEKDRAW